MNPQIDPDSDEIPEQEGRAGLHRILARMSPTKLQLLALILGGVRTPISASRELGIAPVTVYHHLTTLRAQGVVYARRQGRSAVYSVHRLVVLEEVLDLLESRTRSRTYHGRFR